jgi:hypothetical protein
MGVKIKEMLVHVTVINLTFHDHLTQDQMTRVLQSMVEPALLDEGERMTRNSVTLSILRVTRRSLFTSESKINAFSDVGREFETKMQACEPRSHAITPHRHHTRMNSMVCNNDQHLKLSWGRRL